MLAFRGSGPRICLPPNASMRILHVSTRLILGGSQENTVLSCEEQARRGHDVHLAFGPVYGPEGSMLGRVEKFNEEAVRVGRQPIRLHQVGSLVREVSPVHDFRAERQLRHLIRLIDPDVVHTHSSKAGILGRRAAWWIRHRPETARPGLPRIIHTIHGPPFMPLEGGVLRRARVRMTNWVYTLAERQAARRCDDIVSVADAMTEQFLARGIGRPEQFTTVRSGVEVDRYIAPPGEREQRRRALGFRPSDIVIGTVARLAEHKGHDDILAALGAVIGVDPRIRLLWVGDGWWRERLVRGARERYGLESCELDRGQSPTDTTRLVLTGLVPPGEIPRLLFSMDLLVHPSIREGLPRTVVQALLAGVCPVAYDVDGTREVCIDGRSGRLIAPGDIASLRGAVVDLIADEGLRASLAVTGREMVREAFSVKAMCDGLERIYERSPGGEHER